MLTFGKFTGTLRGGIALACATVVAIVTLGAVSVPLARAGGLLLSSCAGANGFNDFGFPDGSTWTYAGSSSFAQSNACSAGRSFKILYSSLPVNKNNYGQWSTTAPPSIQMTGAWTPPDTMQVNPEAYTDGYGFRFAYQGGSTNITAKSACCGGMDYASQINQSFSSRWFLIQASCNQSSGCGAPLNSALIVVPAIEISAVDNTPPTVPDADGQGAGNLAGDLWSQRSGWVRGSWPFYFKASDDSGICNLHESVDGVTLNGPSSTPNTGSWTQCPNPQSMNETVDTTNYPDGPLTLQLSASDAASPANVSSPSETIQVDNQPVTLNLSGPTDALSTAGTQEVMATATAGASGVSGIACSVDGSPYAMHNGAQVQVPVQGLGSHHVSCYAQNNAVDSAGADARSPTETWSLSIRRPSVSTVSFTTLVGSLRCRKVRERVRIAARWVTARVHGQRVRVKLPAQTRTVRVTRCRPRFVRRRVKVGRHWYTEKLVVLPHQVRRTTVRTAFGRATKIDGWLGTAQGDALPGQPVRVMTEPDTPSGQFTQATVATTRSDGTWSATLPAGPSRLVEASYAGSATVEPSTSGAARVTVPASVRLGIHPRRTHWEGTIAISGRLRGCCVPSPVGELVVLHVGWAGGSAEIGHVYARAGGRFRATYTFLRGSGTQTYRLWATTAVESGYPFAAGASRKVSVTVGPR